MMQSENANWNHNEKSVTYIYIYIYWSDDCIGKKLLTVYAANSIQTYIYICSITNIEHSLFIDIENYIIIYPKT